jgi:hypothetical protein
VYVNLYHDLQRHDNNKSNLLRLIFRDAATALQPATLRNGPASMGGVTPTVSSTPDPLARSPMTE